MSTFIRQTEGAARNVCDCMLEGADSTGQHQTRPNSARRSPWCKMQNRQAQHAYRTSIRRATYDENFEKAQHASSDNSVSADALTFGLVGK